jgi:hypothetical protein
MLVLLPFFEAAFVVLEVLLAFAGAVLCVSFALAFVAGLVLVEVQRERLVRHISEKIEASETPNTKRRPARPSPLMST